MSAQTMVTLLNGFYLVLAGLFSLAGTSALVELVIALLRGETHPAIRPNLEPEDA